MDHTEPPGPQSFKLKFTPSLHVRHAAHAPVLDNNREHSISNFKFTSWHFDMNNVPGNLSRIVGEPLNLYHGR